MKKINANQAYATIGGGVCSGTTGSFIAGFCLVGSIFNPVVGVGCGALGVYCAVTSWNKTKFP
jgi:uncharacterized membrane protein